MRVDVRHFGDDHVILTVTNDATTLVVRLTDDQAVQLFATLGLTLTERGHRPDQIAHPDGEQHTSDLHSGVRDHG